MSYVTGRLPLPDDLPVHETPDAASAAALEASVDDPENGYGVWWRDPKDGSRVLHAIAFQNELFISLLVALVSPK